MFVLSIFVNPFNAALPVSPDVAVKTTVFFVTPRYFFESSP